MSRNKFEMDCLGKIQDRFWLACDDLLMRHTNPWELDEALTNWGYGTGACEMMDFVGLVNVLNRRSGHGSPILARMVAEGRIGKVGGVGHYRYPGGGGAVIDPLVEDLILEEARFGKRTRYDVSEKQLLDYLNGTVAAMIDEAMEQGVEHRSICDAMHRALHFPSERIEHLPNPIN